MLVGNGCWGGNETHVDCNGPNAARNDIATYFGKNLISSKLNKAIAATCNFDSTAAGAESPDCSTLLDKASMQVGPHNIYDIYDNCPNLDGGKLSVAAWLQHTGKSTRWLRRYLAANMANPNVFDELDALGFAAAGRGGNLRRELPRAD